MQPDRDTNDLDFWSRRLDDVIGQAIPMKFEHLSKDRVVMTMVVNSRVHQPMGLLHGGVSVVLAESAASTGANRNCPPGMVAVGQEINANHIRSVREGTVRAVAEPLHVGRTSQVWSIIIRDEEERLVCVSRCTLAVIPDPSAPQPTP
jgi:uncharacterized protein (TIGR00369 family)